MCFLFVLVFSARKAKDERQIIALKYEDVSKIFLFLQILIIKLISGKCLKTTTPYINDTIITQWVLQK